MTLQEFLINAPSNDIDALNEAKAYTEIQGQLIDATTVNGILTDFKLIGVLIDIANNKEHIARDICLGVYTGLMGNHPFNMIRNSITGERALAQLNWLIDVGLPEWSVQLSQFRDLMLWRANIVTHPFANITLHDVMLVRGTCPTKQVTAHNGWIIITTSADVPLHNPRLLAVNPRTGQRQWVGNIRGVSMAGMYDAPVPKEWMNTELTVDDVYGVI